MLTLRIAVLVLALLLSATLAGPARGAEPLKLGIHPYLSSAELVRRFSPLAEHLGQQLGRPVVLDISATYDAHIQKIGNGFTDIAFLGPASYVILTERYGGHPPLAVFETAGGRTFHGYVIVRRDSPFTALSHLKGKRFAFGDPDSTMSHLVPRHMLLRSGVNINQFSEAKYLANHDNIALGVLAGAFDAGAVKQETFHQYEPQGLRALAVSPAVPDHLFAARKGLPPETAQAVRKALLSLKDTEKGRSILLTIRKDLVALVPGGERDYDVLRTIIQDLRKAGMEL